VIPTTDEPEGFYPDNTDTFKKAENGRYGDLSITANSERSSSRDQDKGSTTNSRIGTTIIKRREVVLESVEPGYDRLLDVFTFQIHSRPCSPLSYQRPFRDQETLTVELFMGCVLPWFTAGRSRIVPNGMRDPEAQLTRVCHQCCRAVRHMSRDRRSGSFVDAIAHA